MVKAYKAENVVVLIFRDSGEADDFLMRVRGKSILAKLKLRNVETKHPKGITPRRF